MDRFVVRENKGPSNSTPSTNSANKRKSKSERDKEYEKKRKRSFQSKWLSEFSWIRLAEDESTAYCHACRLHPNFADKSSVLYEGHTCVLKGKSKNINPFWPSGNPGCHTAYQSRKAVIRRDTLVAHDSAASHIACMSKFEKKKVIGSLDKAFSKVEASEVERYKKLFNTAYAVAKHSRPFTDYQFLCKVQQKNGMNLGHDHQGRDACTDFINTISTVLLLDVKTNLHKVKFFSIMSDSSTDSAVIDQEAILLRYVHPDTCEPVTTVASIEKLANARADGVCQAIIEGLTKCEINLEQPNEFDPKLVCVNLDGAAVNLGAKTGVAKRLSDTVQNSVLVTHCVAHKLELGVLDAVKEVGYLKKFEDTVKRICKFYSYSPKRRGELQSLASILEESILMHTDIKTIRWVSSKSRALKAVSKDLHVTVTHLEQVVSTSNRADEIGQAKAILKDLKQVKFIKYLHLMTDILEAITATSTLFQNKDLLIFEVKEAIDILFTKLHAMTVESGEELSKFYKNFDTNTNMFNGKLKLTGTLLSFADDNDIHKLLESMNEYIVKRFSDLDHAPLSLYTAFDFRRWPHTLTELSTYGNTDIKTLADKHSDLLTEKEVANISSEWQILKVQVSMQRQSHPLAVYVSILQRNEDSVKHINALVNLMLTISPSTASCERLFSQMNLIKTSHRTRLTQSNLQNQMRIVVNGVPFDEFDPQSAVEYWLKSGNRHIVHKKRVSKVTVQQDVASTSTSTPEVDPVQPMLNELVKILGGEEIAKQKLKTYTENPSSQCQIM